MDYGLWIGFGLNMLEQNGYGLDLELELSPSGTSASGKFACLSIFPLQCILL